jgi:hypothetical protein
MSNKCKNKNTQPSVESPFKQGRHKTSMHNLTVAYEKSIGGIMWFALIVILS